MAFAYLSPSASLKKSLGLKFFLGQGNSRVLEDFYTGKTRPAQQTVQRPPEQRKEKVWPPRVENLPGPPPQPQIKTPAWQPVPKELWPENWQKLFARVKPGWIAWTYLKLGQDLCSQAADTGKDARHALIARIIRDFGMRPGTHTFWPGALPDNSGKPSINRDVFWSGLTFLNCRALVIMGKEFAKNLLDLSAPPRPFQPPRPVHGILYWSIDEIDDLVASSTSYQKYIGNLKRVFPIFLPAEFGRQAG